MKQLLKLIPFFTVCCIFLTRSFVFAQDCTPQLLPSTPSSGPVESKNGYHLPSSGTIRLLVILAEINYDVGTDPNSPWWSADWQPGQSPLWKNSFIDVNTPANGRFSTYFNLASSGNYQVIIPAILTRLFRPY